MKKLFLVFLLLTTVAQAETYRWTDSEGTVHFTDSLDKVPAAGRNSAKLQADAADSSVAPQVEELQERMLQDEGIMALIIALQNEPEIQELLNDPAIRADIQAGDIRALTGNPDFMKLLKNARVREIEQRMQQKGPSKAPAPGR